MCPSYNDITNIIRCMKSGGAPCSLDGLSVIIFKRCPILRTHLSKLITACREKKSFPSIWCRASISLVHKKGDCSDPSNFRPIALQPVVGKILSACIRNKLWCFLNSNDLIDTKTQKGFWPGIAGTTEHIEQMKFILKNQKSHNRSIYIILLDLKNAFGEVHHSLIRFALEQHHIPAETINLIMSQYSEFYVNVTSANSNIRTGSIPVRRGVLQGDTLSPLLFNLVFDSLMSTLNRPEVLCRGVLWGDGCTKSMWAQFADDAAILSDSAEETQLLLNLFQRWTSWADFFIRSDKCHSYAAAK